MNSKPPKPNSQVSIYMNHQNEMEIAEKYSNLPYTLKKLQDFTFSEEKFLVGGGSGPPPPPTSTRQLTILLQPDKIFIQGKIWNSILSNFVFIFFVIKIA